MIKEGSNDIVQVDEDAHSPLKSTSAEAHEPGILILMLVLFEPFDLEQV